MPDKLNEIISREGVWNDVGVIKTIPYYEEISNCLLRKQRPWEPGKITQWSFFKNLHIGYTPQV